MAAEPVTIFSHKLDPAAVVAAVRELAPAAQVVAGETADAAWRQIIIPGRRRLLRRDPPLVLVNDPDYYSGAEWTQQLAGFTALLLQWPRTERTKDVMSLVTALNFAVAIPPEQHVLDLDPPAGDEHVRIVLAVARRLDAVLFTPTTLRDATGRVIISASGEVDPAAVVPNVPAAWIDPESGRPTVRLPADVTFKLLGPNTELTGDEPEPSPPPSPQRVAARALALAAVAGRALLEQEDDADPGVEETRQRILQWADDVGLGEELEPDEWKVLQLPLGAVPRQDAVNATWRVEGLAVLAWALNRVELPPHDQPVDPGQLLPAIGLLNSQRAAALLAEPPLRPPEELVKMQTRLLAIHWRLRDFGINPRAMNFREFCDGHVMWLGKADLSGVRLIGDDLAIGDAAIGNAPTELRQNAHSAARERHLAINWLCGGWEKYSETDTST